MSILSIVIILWLGLCVMVLSWALTDVMSNENEKASKKWHVLTFLTSWVIGLFAPIIQFISLIKKVGNRK